jgi:hypothetical protein
MPVKYNIHCGCGFRSNELAYAGKHAEETGHRLTLHGSITAEDPIDARYMARGKDELIRQRVHADLMSDHEVIAGRKRR